MQTATEKESGTILSPDERVSVKAAIQRLTINAAWQCNADENWPSRDLPLLSTDAEGFGWLGYSGNDPLGTLGTSPGT